MLTGDERYLPARDAGPERRYVRDYIDARYNVGEFLLPRRRARLRPDPDPVRPTWSLPAIIVTYGMVLAFLLDAIYLRIRLRKLLTAKFGSIAPRPRVLRRHPRLQLRRWRMPRPKVRRGEYPS